MGARQIQVTRRHITLAGVTAGIALVGSGIGTAIKGIAELDHKLGASTTAVDSLFHNDSLQTERIERIERKLRLGRWKGRAASQPEQVGLARRVWRMLF